MIIQEYYTTRSDGVRLIRTYSNRGFMIERGGIMYDEAIDPEDLHREYTETNTPIFEDEKAEFDEDPIAFIDKRISQTIGLIS